MSSLTLFKITCAIISLQITVLSQLAKSIQLKPSTISSAADISVTLGPGASVTFDTWNIEVVSQQSADLNIHLGPSYGFHPKHVSTLTLWIEGATTNQTLNDDGEILFIFAVEDQYFGEQISIDEAPYAYKQCPDINEPLITRNITQMINSPLPERFYRYCKNPISQNPVGIDYWDNTGGSAYRKTATWPIFITITNDPIANTVDYQYGDYTVPIGNKPTLKSHYTSSFPANQGLNIYIAGESPGEDFYIDSIDITYSYIGTDPPTTNPTTIAPTTISPSNSPTSTMPTTIQPSTVAPTTAIPTVNPSLSPTTLQPTTVSPTDTPSVMPSVYPTTLNPTTKNPTYLPTWNPSNSPSMTKVMTSEPPLVIPRTTNEAVVTVSDTIETQNTNDGASKTEEIEWNDSLYYIIAIVLLALLCVCCVILFIAWKKRSADEKTNVSIKDYEGVHTMHRQSASLQQNQLYKYDGNNSAHIKKVSMTGDGDNDLTIPYNGNNHKSSESKLNNAFHLNNDIDFSNHISSAVTGDEMVLEDIHNHMETAGGPNDSSEDGIIDKNRRDGTDSYMVINQGNNIKKNTFSSFNAEIEMNNRNNDRMRGKTFNDNLVNVAVGNDMMMNDVINQMETKGGDFDSNDSESESESETETKSNSNEEEDDTIDDDEYFRSGYEMGMVNVSKISEMAPQSKTPNYVDIDPIGNIDNNDSLIMEGNTLNDDYEDEDAYDENDDVDQSLDEMETAGFIDGDYNDLEYEDEYYQDEDTINEQYH